MVEAEPAAKLQSRHDGKAIAGLVLGIASVVFSWFWLLALPLSVVGIIMSVIGLKSQKRGMAVGGLITSIVGFIFMVVIVVVIISMTLHGVLQNLNLY